jgi:hypothetical protein
VCSKCRCAECKEANRLYYHENKKRTEEEGKNRIVDAGPAREHILWLSTLGIGYRQVAEAALVGVTVVAEVKAGRKSKIRERSLKRILGVGEDARADQSYVPAKSTHALVQKLVSKGYSRAELARRLGYRSPSLQLKEGRVTLRKAHKVQKMYNSILAEEKEERNIAEEMKYFCTECGMSHRKKDRLGRLRSCLPAPTSEIQDRLPCTYSGSKNSSPYRQLLRDLHDVGAKKEGILQAEGDWYLT